MASVNVIGIDTFERSPIPGQASRREMSRTIEISKEPMYVSPPSVAAGKDTIYALVGGVITAIR